MKIICLSLTFLIISFAAQAQIFGKIYEAENMKEMVAQYKIVAVVPFKYKLTMRKLPKGMTEEDVKRQEEKGSISAQNSFYTYALEKKEKGQASVDIQDINRTKVLLSRNNIDEKTINNYLPEELCKILEVDAFITGEISASQPMSEGAAVATQLLIGYSRTNEATAAIKIYDKSGKLVWTYGKEVDGGLGSDQNDMIRRLMRKTANRFPYFKD